MRTLVEAGEIETLVAERVWSELERALGEQQSVRFFEVLRECGALQRLLPELDALFGVPQPPGAGRGFCACLRGGFPRTHGLRGTALSTSGYFSAGVLCRTRCRYRCYRQQPERPAGWGGDTPGAYRCH